MAFKINILRISNNWHQVIYKLTFFHLKEFDVFELAWELLSHKLIWLVQKLLKVVTMLYSRLSEEQLEELRAAYNQELDNIDEKLESKKGKSMRSSILMRQSILFSDLASTTADESVIKLRENLSKDGDGPNKKKANLLQPKKGTSPAPNREKSAPKKEK